jgi:hypothetical protein
MTQTPDPNPSQPAVYSDDGGGGKQSGRMPMAVTDGTASDMTACKGRTNCLKPKEICYTTL